MKTKQLAILAIAALTVVACSKTEVMNPETGTPATIRLRSAATPIVGEVGTRAPYVGTIATTNPLTALVPATTTTGNYSTPHANGTMTFVGGTAPSSYNVGSLTDYDTQSAFPGAEADKLYLAGLYPASGWTLSGAATVGTIAITGREDVMAAAEVETSSAEVKNNIIRTLTFRHQLTKLEIDLQAVTNAAAGRWGKITRIELVKVGEQTPKRTVGVNLKTGMPTTVATPATGIMPLYAATKNGETVTYTNNLLFDGTVENGIALTETRTRVGYLMIAPFMADGVKDLTFHVYAESTGGTAIEVDAPLNVAGNTQGKAFGVNFTFSATTTNIQVAANVIEWDEAGEVEVPVDK